MSDLIKAKAEEIALKIYPEDLFVDDEFSIDRNARHRDTATEVLEYCLHTLDDEEVISNIAKSIYRREHNEELQGENTAMFSSYVRTALLHYELALRDTAEGAEK